LILRILRKVATRAQEITTTPRYTDLIANLRYYELLYGDALAALPRTPRGGSRIDATHPSSDDHATLDQKYRDYLEARMLWARKTITLLGSRSP
jgi:hypothetical protein